MLYFNTLQDTFKEDFDPFLEKEEGIRRDPPCCLKYKTRVIVVPKYYGKAMINRRSED